MKNNPKYYEGILQLRHPTEEVLDYFEKLAKEKKLGIAKIEELKTGYDFYVDSNKKLLAIGKKLFERFGGVKKISRKLHTVRKQTSKKLYRMTVMFKPPQFKKGDIIDYKGQKLEVKMLKKKILGKDIKTGEKVWFDYEDV